MSVSRSHAELRAALAASLLSPLDAAQVEVDGRLEAAVLVPLYSDGADLRIVLTRRTDTMRLHAGQLSFPGGQRGDGEDLRETALRESFEEIGLPPSEVEIVGALRPTPTFVTDYAIHPFVGIIMPGQVWTPNDSEVAAVIEPTVESVRTGWARRAVDTPRGTLTADTYLVGDDLIWGATARIVSDLLDTLDHLPSGVG